MSEGHGERRCDVWTLAFESFIVACGTRLEALWEVSVDSVRTEEGQGYSLRRVLVAGYRWHLWGGEKAKYQHRHISKNGRRAHCAARSVLGAEAVVALVLAPAGAESNARVSRFSSQSELENLLKVSAVKVVEEQKL